MTTQTIWQVSCGEYSDWRILALFTTKALADEYVVRHNARERWDLADVDEVSLYDTLPTWEERWYVDMQGNPRRKDIEVWPGQTLDDTSRLHRSEEEAVKAHQDREARRRAEAAGIA